ncbi:Gfo/Idh/MocA family oxidoreductase [Botrimarina sp.]|uniref:Gfo/Idh/MocA family protein n=1 Tax=Botrimarina sp. TaxID=2795802 RepID=UPI0032EF1262
MNRRDLLKSAAATGGALAAPYFFWTPKSLGQELAADKTNIGVIGAGSMGGGNIATAKEWLNVVAIADPDRGHLESFNQNLADGKASLHADYRAILDRDDIKVLHIATPDHWHTKPLVEAMRAGKDIYCEKPLTLTIDEGKLIRQVQKETGAIVQVGTQQRSQFDLFVKAMAIVAEGRLGKIHSVQAAIGGGPSSPVIPVAAPPSELDWDRWLGPAPEADYRVLSREDGRAFTNCHYEFRWWYEYSGGKLTDWGAHHVDICNWALRLNGQTDGPLSIDGTAEHPVEFRDGEPTRHDQYNTATTFHFTVKYPGDTQLVIRHDTDNGVLIEGDKGKIFVNRGRLTGEPVEQLVENPLPDDAISKVYKGLPVEHDERKAHWANFLYCSREGKEPISDVHSHVEMLNICHLAGIAARLGRPLQWDAESEQITGDDQANSMLSRPYREGYEIEGA